MYSSHTNGVTFQFDNERIKNKNEKKKKKFHSYNNLLSSYLGQIINNCSNASILFYTQGMLLAYEANNI